MMFIKTNRTNAIWHKYSHSTTIHLIMKCGTKLSRLYVNHTLNMQVVEKGKQCETCFKVTNSCLVDKKK